MSIDVVTNTSKFGKGLRTAITGLGALAVGAGYAFKQFEESEKVISQTEAVLKSTGGVANVTAKQVTELANAISKKTGIDDEAIASGENLLLTFTNIQNRVGEGNDIFNQATQTITDMSVALGQDFKSSAIQVGKALQDPILGMTALRRVGVSFTEAQTEMVGKWVEQGQVLRAQKFILGELTTEFGGSAAAQKTASQTMATELGNLAEVIGSVLAPVITKLVGWITQLAEWFTALPPGMQTFITSAAAVSAVVIIVAKAFSLLSPAVHLATGAIKAISLALSTNPYILIAAATILIAILIVKNWDTIKKFLLAAWDAIVDAAKWAWDHIAIFILGPMKLVIDFLIDHWRGFKTFFIGVWNLIADIIGPIVERIVATIQTIIDVIMDIVDAVKTAIEWLGKLGSSGESLVPGGPRRAGGLSSAQHGGEVLTTGMALVHKGEVFSGVNNEMGFGFGGGINITINGDVTGEEVVRKVRDGLLKLKARNATTGL